jgi:formylglycine-generating enzyme required for sulfatase activity
MAVVYKAYDTRLERDVALKLIRTEAIPQEQHERLIHRFEREARSMAKMRHPNIMQIFDYGEVNGTPYLVMEYLPGGTLKQYTGSPMDYRQAARLLAPIADALSFAHQLGIIHRDVKPSNIIISQTGIPLLSDFGIAKLLEDQDASLTNTGFGVGTPQYMAPEQWQNQICPQTDIYALAIIFYELITGQKPYSADTPAAIAIQQVTEPLVRPRTYVADLPESVEKVLFKALSLDPQNRHPEMRLFASELASIAIGNLQKPDYPEAKTQTDEELTFDPFEEQPTFDQLEDKPSPPSKTSNKTHVIRIWQIVLIASLVLICIAGTVFGAFKLVGIFMPDQVTEGLAVLESDGNKAEAPESQTTHQIHHGENPALSPTSAEPITFQEPLTLTATPLIDNTPTPTLRIGSSTTRDADGMLMMYVPAGSFVMGSAQNDPDAFSHEKPQHEVYQDVFWMDAYEVSNAMFAAFVSQTDYRTLAERQGFSYMYDDSYKWIPIDGINWRNPMGPETYADDMLPVVHVSYDDATVYCQWAGGRLPTEAEWEKAARGEDGRTYPWGNTFDPDKLHHYSSSGPVSVDLFPQGKSPYGIYQMAGNAFEWTKDWYRSDYYGISTRENPTGPSAGEYRAIRGGSWNNSQKNVRAAHRDYSMPNYMNHLLGFRCVMDAE